MTTERLQSAIAKARQERGQAAPINGKDRTRPAPRPARGAEAAQQAWDALPRLQLKPRKLRSRRIVTAEGGAEATAFDVLRTRLLQRMAENGWRRVAVTSPSPGCGKSTVALNLAFGLARQAERRVVSIEADLRRPSHEELLGLPKHDRSGKSHSVADLFEGRSAFAETALRPRDNLALAMSGAGTANASDILLGSGVGSRLSEIEADYAPDVTLFDMPPLMVNDDTQAFLGHVDCAVLIGAAGETSTKELDDCERLLASGTNVAGIVLNKSRFSTEGRYDSYYD